MHRLPLISIALCTYNGEKFLAQQIESLLAQDYPNFEIVVCDDCSSDNSLAVAASFQSPRIRIHANEQNLGFNKNFERAFQLCSGELIAPCDQDDLWDPRKLSLLQAHLGTHMLAYCDSALIDERGDSMHQNISDKLNMYSGQDWMPFLFINCVSGHASLFRRELLQHACPIPKKFYYDWWLASVAASLGGVLYLAQSLVYFRQHSASCTDIAGLKPSDKKTNISVIQRISAEAEWMRQLAQLGSGTRATTANELRRLWLARKDQYFCPKLAWLLLRYGKKIFFISKKRGMYIRFAIKSFWGIKTKQRLNPKKYTVD